MKRKTEAIIYELSVRDFTMSKTLNATHPGTFMSLDLITKLEKEKKIFVLRPSQLIPIGRLEKDKEVIQQMYDLGVSDCNNQLENLKKYLRG